MNTFTIFASKMNNVSIYCEADSTMLIVNTNGVITSSVFVPRKDKLKEIWDGFREGPEGAKENYLFDIYLKKLRSIGIN